MLLAMIFWFHINGGCYTPPCTNGYSCPLAVGHHNP
jgi:hypothetical protein